MKPRHWIACYVTAALLASLVGWLAGKLCVLLICQQIDQHFDNIHAQLLTLQSNLTEQIRSAPPIVLPNPWVSNIVVTNLYMNLGITQDSVGTRTFNFRTNLPLP